MKDCSSVDRREILRTFIGGMVLTSALASRLTFAGGRPRLLDRWAKDVVELNQSLGGGEIGAVQWQDKIEALNRSVPVAELVRYLDIDALAGKFTYASNLADHADPKLPPEILAAAGLPERPWFVRIFGLRKGGAIIPHVHNQMVSAHLVVGGSFHVRTHDRIQDLDDAIVLKPTRDAVYGVGEILSMSEVRNNQHWLVALEPRSLTFDVGVVDIARARTDLTIPANEYNMIFVDADRPPETSGLVVAPVMTFKECAKKYADWVG